MDGIQHFTDKKAFFENGDTPFDKRVKADIIKNEYCLNHKIPILRIPYIYKTDTNKDIIIHFLDMFIQKQLVAKEILEFYRRFDFNNYVYIVSKLEIAE